MLKRLALTIPLVITLAGVTGQTAFAEPHSAEKETCIGVRKGINYYRGATWTWQDKIGIKRDRSLFKTKEIPASCKYAKWVAEYWRDKAAFYHKKYNVLWNSDSIEAVKNVIRFVFGKYGEDAIAVAHCETGGTFSKWAENGQYKNIFQMGQSERETYGWHTAGSPVIVAARAAWNYFAATGYDWSPWQCRPYGLGW